MPSTVPPKVVEHQLSACLLPHTYSCLTCFFLYSIALYLIGHCCLMGFTLCYLLTLTCTRILKVYKIEDLAVKSFSNPFVHPFSFSLKRTQTGRKGIILMWSCSHIWCITDYGTVLWTIFHNSWAKFNEGKRMRECFVFLLWDSWPTVEKNLQLVPEKLSRALQHFF